MSGYNFKVSDLFPITELLVCWTLLECKFGHKISACSFIFRASSYPMYCLFSHIQARSQRDELLFSRYKRMRLINERRLVYLDATAQEPVRVMG